MRLRIVYLLLAAAGLLIPLGHVAPWVAENGLNGKLFLAALFANRVSGFFALDVVLSAVALLAGLFAERRQMRTWWFPALGTLLFGVSFGLPLFLYLRERRLHPGEASEWELARPSISRLGTLCVGLLRRLWIPALALLVTFAFFIEYTGAYRRVHIPYDLEGYHYPLNEYAFQALKQGRLPLWDDAQYLGIPFAANLQVALFYPPTWVMYVLNWTRNRLPYSSLEYLMLAHAWLGFLLCLYWLKRGRLLRTPAAILGAGIFAFSAYVPAQMSHLGLVCGYVWIPLGWWAIDDFRQQGWRSLWKLAVASAMCFLAGYPSTWAAFAVCMAAYAVAGSRPVRDTLFAGAGLGGSLLLAGITLLPAAEAAGLMTPEPKFGPGSGMRDPAYFLSLVIPNFYNFDLGLPDYVNPGKDCLYVGSAALIGLAFAIVARRRFREMSGLVAVLIISLMFLVNPWGLLGELANLWPMATRVLSGWYFFAGFFAGLAGLAAIGLDQALSGKDRPAVSAWAAPVSVLFGLIWSARLLMDWADGHSAISAGWLSGLDTLAACGLCLALLGVAARSTGFWRNAALVTLCIATASEYKVFGTSRRLGVVQGPPGENPTVGSFPGISDEALAAMRSGRIYRVVSDEVGGPDASRLRLGGFTTPQGFDPLIPTQFVSWVTRHGKFLSNRMFALPANSGILRLLGIKYFLTTESSPTFNALKINPDFREIPPDSYSHVFEVIGAEPPYGWEPGGSGPVIVDNWTHERRHFRVTTEAPAVFRLGEQFYPGWAVTIDGKPAPLSRCHDILQCVAVPQGNHKLEFRYRSRWLIAGAWMTALSTLALVAFVQRLKRRTQ